MPHEGQEDVTSTEETAQENTDIWPAILEKIKNNINPKKALRFDLITVIKVKAKEGSNNTNQSHVFCLYSEICAKTGK